MSSHSLRIPNGFTLYEPRGHSAHSAELHRNVNEPFRDFIVCSALIDSIIRRTATETATKCHLKTLAHILCEVSRSEKRCVAVCDVIAVLQDGHIASNVFHKNWSIPLFYSSLSIDVAVHRPSIADRNNVAADLRCRRPAHGCHV